VGDILAEVTVGNDIRLAGEDVRKDDRVVPKVSAGAPSGHRHARLAGLQAVMVVRRPRVAILATGDEVVEIDAPLRLSIRNSEQLLQMRLRSCSMAALAHHLALPGDRLATGEQDPLRPGAGPDLLLTSEAVSVGDFDVVKNVAGSRGRDASFWRVRMKPGKAAGL